MKKISRINRILIIGFIGFGVFQFLAMCQGQNGNMGYALGYATLSIAFMLFMFAGVILDTLYEDKNTDNEPNN